MERNRIRFSYVRHLIAAAMLLLAGAACFAKVGDHAVSGSVGKDTSLKYSFSGGTVREDKQVQAVKWYTYDVAPESTLSFSCSCSDPDAYIVISTNVGYDTMTMKVQQKKSASLDIKVPAEKTINDAWAVWIRVYLHGVEVSGCSVRVQLRLSQQASKEEQGGSVALSGSGEADNTKDSGKAKGSGKSKDSAKADGTKKKSKGWIVVAVIAVLLVLFLRRKPKQPARSMQMPQPMQPGMGMQSPGMQPGPTQSPGQPYGSTMGQPFQNMGQPQQFGQPQQNMGGYSVVQCPYCGTQIAQGTRFCTGCGAQLM